MNKWKFMQMIRTEARKRDLEFKQTNSKFYISDGKGNSVQGSVHESGERKWKNLCWVGVNPIYYEEFLKQRDRSFIVVVDSLEERKNYIVIPFKKVEPYMRRMVASVSFTLFFHQENIYFLKKQIGTLYLEANDLEPMFATFK